MGRARARDQGAVPSSPGRRILLDTSVLILHLRGKPEGTALMRWAGASGRPCVSAVTVLELAQGMHESEVTATEALLKGLETIAVTGEIAWEAGRLIARLRRRGVTIHFPDGLIAASALAAGAMVLTHNVKHFEAIPDLDVVDARTDL